MAARRTGKGLVKVFESSSQPATLSIQVAYDAIMQLIKVISMIVFSYDKQ